MSALDPREVLLYLNELGYTNITAKQLKEFMKGKIPNDNSPRLHYWIVDLKKLIKYEQRKEQRRIKPPLTSTIPELSKFTKVESYLYSTSTVSSKAKEVKPKENIITVEVKRNRPRVSENEPAKTNAGEVNKEKETNASEVTKDENPKSLGKLSEKSQAISRPTTSCKKKSEEINNLFNYICFSYKTKSTVKKDEKRSGYVISPISSTVEEN